MNARPKKRALRSRVNAWTYELIFCGVVIALFLLVKVVPFFLSIGYSFTDWNGVTGDIHFIWLDNFIRLKDDAQFWYTLGFTLKFCLITIAAINVLGFALAYLLTKPMRIRNMLRAGFYIPNVLGGLVLGFIWQFIFLKVFPAIGEATGIPLFNLIWLGTPATAFWGLTLVQIWQVVGYYMLFYIAGFTAIPADCMESARMDGASGFTMLTKITIPLMMPTITRCLFLSVINSFKIYTLNLSLTGGNPYLSSEAIAMNIYRTAFTENSMGYGTAKSLVFTLIVVLITSLQVWLTSRKEVEL